MISPAYINSMSSVHPHGLEGEANYLKALEPDYKELIPNPTLRRRMSRIVKMGVACGLECIGAMPKEDIHAIITATGLGCLADTEKFMNNLLDNNEQLLNPTAFIQSTFNTVGAQIALLCQNQAYNVTYVHRGLSFESALLDGLLRLSEGDRNVLVGAFDEITPASFTIQERMGLYRNTHAGEGAQFFLLGRDKSEETFAQIHFPGMAVVTNKEIEDYLSINKLSPTDIDLLVTGKNGNTSHDAIYSAIEKELFPHADYATFKDISGEYQTATAYAVWQTAQQLKADKNIRHALIYNRHQGMNDSLLLLSRA